MHLHSNTQGETINVPEKSQAKSPRKFHISGQKSDKSPGPLEDKGNVETIVPLEQSQVLSEEKGGEIGKSPKSPRKSRRENIQNMSEDNAENRKSPKIPRKLIPESVSPSLTKKSAEASQNEEEVIPPPMIHVISD